MQQEDDHDAPNDDGGGPRPSAYQNDPPNPNLVSFELPGDDLDDDGYFKRVEPFFDRWGRPKSPNDYRWSSDDDEELGPLSTDDKSFRDNFGRVFHRIGLNPRQARQMEKAQVEWVKNQRKAAETRRSTATDRAKAELSKDFGGEYAARVAAANRAFKEHAGSRDASVLAKLELSDGTPLSSHPAFVRMLSNVGAATPARGGRAGSAQEEIARIQKEAMAKGLDPTSKRWPHEELQKWYDEAYSSAALDTSNSLPPGSRAR